jgi:histone H3/H4
MSKSRIQLKSEKWTFPNKNCFVVNTQIPNRYFASSIFKFKTKIINQFHLLFTSVVVQVREILTRDGEYRITEMAIEALRESAEAYLIGLLEDSYMLSLHAKRVTLMPTDMRLALLLRRDLFSESG